VGSNPTPAARLTGPAASARCVEPSFRQASVRSKRAGAGDQPLPRALFPMPIRSARIREQQDLVDLEQAHGSLRAAVGLASRRAGEPGPRPLSRRRLELMDGDLVGDGVASVVPPQEPVVQGPSVHVQQHRAELHFVVQHVA
jgi:hypothetical protein